MALDFRCYSCGKRFSVDDASVSTCPYCKSDNIERLSSSWQPMVYASILFVVFCVGGYFIPIPAISQKEPPKEIDTPNVQIVVEKVYTKQDSVRILKVSPLEIKGEKYAFAVEAEGQNLEYILMHMSDTIRQNNTGKFADVPASEDCTYTVVVRNTETGFSDDRMVSGFIKIAPPKAKVQPIAKLSAQEVANLLNSRNSSRLETACRRNVAISVSNLQLGEPAPNSIKAIVMNIGMTWSSVEVLNVEYDSTTNHVKSITLRANHL